MSPSLSSKSLERSVVRPKAEGAAMAAFLIALPHFAIPAGASYRPPAASLLLVLWGLFALLKPRTIRLRLSDPGALRGLLLAFFLLCIISTAYGYWNLNGHGRLTLRLRTGDIDYLRVCAERLLQIALLIVTFEVVRNSRHDSGRILRWWLLGTSGAVVLHAMTYLLTDDLLLQRAGTFNEGNLGGLYYLLSVFVALEYRRGALQCKDRNYFFVVALAGVVLSRSTASIVLISLLISVKFLMLPGHSAIRTLRVFSIFVILPVIAVILTSTGLDFGIGEKLFGEDVTANSFSRIDRLESISAALQMFASSPVFGNGLQTYGFISNDLLEGILLLTYDGSYRRIPNNIYAELIAELGIIGLTLFLSFIVSTIQLVLRKGSDGHGNWLLGVGGILLYWNAFPTYSVLFIWAYFGLMLRHQLDPKPARYIHVEAAPGEVR